MGTKGKVVVGISGGVDSAVAACLLQQEGWEVIGLNLRVLDTPEAAPVLRPSPLVISDSPGCAFPIFSLNLSARFSREVIEYFSRDYLAGRTPNPCMVCNKAIKWSGLLQGAELLGADMIATGHYARTACSEGRHRLFKGADPNKDQSYFLWMLSEEELSRTLFPLGGLTKEEVRERARDFALRSAEKKESQEICFVPGDDYRAWLESDRPGLGNRLAGGEIVDVEGTVLGHHRGYPFYTVGQRRGLGLSGGEPLYVTRIEAETNRLHVGPKQALLSRQLTAAKLNWIGIDPPRAPFDTTARIRYRDTAAPCRVEPLAAGCATVRFEAPKSAVTRGQAVVFYRGDEVLGGGIIEKVGPNSTNTN